MLSKFHMWAEVGIGPLISWLCTRTLHWSWQQLQGHIQRWIQGSGSGSSLEKREVQLRFDLKHGRCAVKETLPVFIPELSVSSADLRKRSGPWEIKCLEVWVRASLFPRGFWRVELLHPCEHLVLGFPASHIMTEQLMYTWMQRDTLSLYQQTCCCLF